MVLLYWRGSRTLANLCQILSYTDAIKYVSINQAHCAAIGLSSGGAGGIAAWGQILYGGPYWCSRSTFASKIATSVKVLPWGGGDAPPPHPPVCSATGFKFLSSDKEGLSWKICIPHS